MFVVFNASLLKRNSLTLGHDLYITKILHALFYSVLLFTHSIFSWHATKADGIW